MMRRVKYLRQVLFVILALLTPIGLAVSNVGTATAATPTIRSYVTRHSNGYLYPVVQHKVSGVWHSCSATTCGHWVINNTQGTLRFAYVSRERIVSGSGWRDYTFPYRPDLVRADYPWSGGSLNQYTILQGTYAVLVSASMYLYKY